MPAEVPPFHGNIAFNAQHSPMGAFFSFTCGHFGTRGGFGLQIGKPGNQDLYIGVKDGDRYSDSPLRCLPFYEGAKDDAAAAFLVEQNRTGDPAHQKKVVSYSKDEIKRHYGWATDRWVTPEFEFTIYTPFGTVPSVDPNQVDAKWCFPVLEQRYRLLPAVVATLVVDNTSGATPKTGFFAVGFADKGTRILDTGLESAVGFALRNELGVAGRVIEHQEFTETGGATWFGDPFAFMRWTPNAGTTSSVHLLGNCPGIGFEVPAGEKRTLQLVLGVYIGGIVTTRLEGRYWYTRHYGNLEDVLNRGFYHLDQLVEDAERNDEELLESGLSADQQFLLAHATRSYYGSTMLLDVGGQPFWVVNEGEYCMMNTLDLSVDHVFWELKHNPWVVRNLLDNFARYYSYHDRVKVPKTGELRPGGISFTHDMGVHNNFSPFGHSSYELPNLDAVCFSYMTAEQLCNWVLIAACYVAATGDLNWARQNEPLFDACFRSLVNRGAESGIVSRDSSRCSSGAEITTYDSLDHSLAQTRSNVYIATKAWAAYRGLSLIWELLGAGTEGQERLGVCHAMIERIEQAVRKHVQSDGHLPAVFEEGNAGYASRILPAAEGLAYLEYWCHAGHPKSRATQASPLQDILRRHTLALLRDPERRNHFPDGGIRLSSTSNNSWMSKIALFQHVCRIAFKLGEDGQDITPLLEPAKGNASPACSLPPIEGSRAPGFEKADAAHVKWQTEGESAYWAMSDQMVNGVAQGSKYYPRCVTTVLWLDEGKR